jgi:hypothetical protein
MTAGQMMMELVGRQRNFLMTIVIIITIVIE